MRQMLLLASCVCCALAVAHAQSSLTNGLVAYYPFDNNAGDASGFGRDGTVHGAVLSPDRFGILNRCYTFNGVNDYIDASSTINDVVNTFTMSLWFNTTNVHHAFPSANYLISPSQGTLTWGGNSAGAGFSAGIDKIQVWEHAADYHPVVLEYAGVLTGWNSVTVIYSNRVPRLYVNGAFVAQGAQSARDPVRPSNGQKYEPVFREQGGIGGFQQDQTTDNFFRGQIDEVRIYDRALSDSEIQQLYSYEAFCSPRRARATATVVNGFVVGAIITDGGCGYTNAPLVLIQGGGGSGVIATAVITNGIVVDINIISAGCCYTNGTPKIAIASPPFVPTVSINVSKVKVTQNVVLGRNYVLESSTNVTDWTAVWPPFTAISESITDEFDVDLTGRFFRIRQVP